MTHIRLCLAEWFDNNMNQIFMFQILTQSVIWRCHNSHPCTSDTTLLAQAQHYVLEVCICYALVWKTIALLEMNRANKSHAQSYEETYKKIIYVVQS